MVSEGGDSASESTPDSEDSDIEETSVDDADSDVDVDADTDDAGGEFEPDVEEDRMQAFFSWLWVWMRDVSLGIILVVCLFGMLAAASGVWPPLTVVESGSMEGSINQGDITVVTTTDRFVSDHADQYGIVTHEVGAQQGVEYFGDYGSVIVFEQPGAVIPTIHRAMFYVEEDEDWFDRANPEYFDDAQNCGDVEYCPAPNSGYITKGDNNDYYDQDIGLTPPVADEWIIGASHLRIPYIGWIRLVVDFFA